MPGQHFQPRVEKEDNFRWRREQWGKDLMAKWADALLLLNRKRRAGGGKDRTVASAAIRAAGLVRPPQSAARGCSEQQPRAAALPISLKNPGSDGTVDL